VPGTTKRILSLIYTEGVPGPSNFEDLCQEMYEEKTRTRVNKFLKKHLEVDQIKEVNGVLVKPIQLYLDSFPWDYVNKTAVPSDKFHGDVQPENIIVKPNGDVVFIDWRDSFAGNTEVGDMYYDLGKLWHDLIVSNQKILQKKYSVNTQNNSAQICIELKSNLVEAMHTMKQYCIEKELDWQKIELLGALQYLTIACLYDDKEFATFLFLLGKLCLELLSKGTEEVINSVDMKLFYSGEPQ
jgi:thiamine kinase-like enzyme